jgi:NAD(P)H dehydrogenase (quinone)
MEAAKRAGVRHLHYTAIQQSEGGKFEIPQVTRWDRKTEVTILRNTMVQDRSKFI